MLTDAQVERYSRQIILQPVGGRGQEALLRAQVAVAGDHAAADAALLYLAAAGVGHLSRLGSRPAVDRINPDVTIAHGPVPTAPGPLAALASTHALVVGVGPVEAMQSVHDACNTAGRPLLWGFSAGSRAWIARLGHGPAHACPTCLAPRIDAPSGPRPAASAAPVAAVWTGTLLASEALKALLGMPDAMAGRCLTFDAAAGQVESLRLTPACSPAAPPYACPRSPAATSG